MNQFLLQQGTSKELEPFPHIIEFALKKNSTIQLNSLDTAITNTLRIYYIFEGKFEWIINQQHHMLYPGDMAIVLPGQELSGENAFLNIGTLCWINIHLDKLDSAGKLVPGKWSGLSKAEALTIGKILLLNETRVLLKVKAVAELLQDLEIELHNQEIGYRARVNQLIDSLLILITRQLTSQNNSHRDFPQTFMKLEQMLRQNLAHQWTVEEMAALVGLGTTAFTEKAKNYTGFSPFNYLINIRISEAIKLLKRPDVNVTDIALVTGFYSSQHFSTTFRKLTGYTPSAFRKINMPNTK
ncbi:MAG TPA: AraC family transcriptional regulator [Mucilaginibacter sp.]